MDIRPTIEGKIKCPTWRVLQSRVGQKYAPNNSLLKPTPTQTLLRRGVRASTPAAMPSNWGWQRVAATILRGVLGQWINPSWAASTLEPKVWHHKQTTTQGLGISRVCSFCAVFPQIMVTFIFSISKHPFSIQLSVQCDSLFVLTRYTYCNHLLLLKNGFIKIFKHIWKAWNWIRL